MTLAGLERQGSDGGSDRSSVTTTNVAVTTTSNTSILINKLENDEDIAPMIESLKTQVRHTTMLFSLLYCSDCHVCSCLIDYVFVFFIFKVSESLLGDDERLEADLQVERLLLKDKRTCSTTELEMIRRERNRMHAKKTRLRKKRMILEMEAVSTSM